MRCRSTGSSHASAPLYALCPRRVLAATEEEKKVWHIARIQPHLSFHSGFRSTTPLTARGPWVTHLPRPVGDATRSTASGRNASPSPLSARRVTPAAFTRARPPDLSGGVYTRSTNPRARPR